MPNILRLGGGAMGLFLGLVLFSFMNSPDVFPFADTVIPIVQAVLLGVGMFMMLPRQMTTAEMLLREFSGSKVSAEELDNVIKKGMEKVDALLAAADQIEEAAVSLKIEKIARVADRIFEGFIEDPDDIRRSRDFLDLYLGKTVDIVSSYAKLESKGDAAGATLQQVKELLDTIEDAFEAQYEKNLEDDLLDLSVQSSVLEKKIKLSGI